VSSLISIILVTERHPTPSPTLQVVAGATDYPLQPGQGLPPQQPQYDPSSFGGADSSSRLGEAARQSLAKATNALRRYGWMGFWIQLTLSVVSGVILLFSVAFTSQVGVERDSLGTKVRLVNFQQ
jgi:hypothetical protein